MRAARLVFLFATAILMSGTFLASTASAQGTQAAEGESLADVPTRKTPAMRERVYTRLSEAQACAEIDDVGCAQALLAEVREMDDLNGYELAQMWNFYAFIYFGLDNYREAIRAYEMVIQQPDLPLALEIGTMYTLTQLYFQQEDYEEALEMLDRWFAVPENFNPGPESYVLKAQIFYQVQRYREGIEPVNQAIAVAATQGKAPQENWYRLLNVFHYELEDYPSVIQVLRTMIEMWPKREYFVQLSAMYGQEGEDGPQLGLYETAYEAGWLARSNEIVQLSQLLLQANVPVKAAKIMELGLDNGSIESTENNWRILAQSWQIAQEDEKAIPAMTRAAGLADDGELDVRLAQSYQNLSRWDDCIESARTALRKGDLRRDDQSSMILGACLFETKEYGAARTAFNAAAEDTRSRTAARSWIQYVDAEEDREQQLNAALNR